MKKTFIFLVGLIIGFIVFMPKKNLYFTFQHFLQKEKIYINSEINSNLISLNLKNGTIFYKGIDAVKFKDIFIYPFLFFNNLNATNIKIDFGNLNINNLDFTYSIINPLKVYIKGDSNFGKIDGIIDLVNRKIKVYILNLNNSTLKAILKKDKKGYFYYELF